jgi:hypothetical protein
MKKPAENRGFFDTFEGIRTPVQFLLKRLARGADGALMLCFLPTVIS